MSDKTPEETPAEGPETASSQRSRVDAEPLLELPTIGRPLFREDIERARRRRRTAVVTVLGLGAATAAVWFWATHLREVDPEEDAPEVAEAPPPRYVPPPSLFYNQDGTIPVPAADPDAIPDAGPITAHPSGEAPIHAGATVRSEALFGDARAFRQALQMRGCATRVPRDRRGRSRRPRFSPMPVGDKLYFERDGAGRLLRFEYHQGPTEYVVATLTPEGTYSGRIHQREIERRRLEVGGRIRSTLGEALDRAGLGSSMVGVFVEVFDGKMNFSTGAREGDTFRVIVDEERIDGEFLRYATPLALEYVSARAGRLRAFYYEMGDRGDWYDGAGRAIRGGWPACRCNTSGSPRSSTRTACTRSCGACTLITASTSPRRPAPRSGPPRTGRSRGRGPRARTGTSYRSVTRMDTSRITPICTGSSAASAPAWR